MGDMSPIQLDEAAIYKQIFELLSTHTEEYDNFINFIKQNILPHLPSYNHFLDIGAGRGNITKPIAGQFQRATIVEPNTHFFEEVMAWSQSAHPHLIGHNSPWEDVQIDIAAELVVVSHVLYYVPLGHHSEFISKAYRQLYPHGRMILALNGTESDIWKLARLLYTPTDFAQLPYAEKLHSNLQAWGYNATFHPFESRIVTQTEEQMRYLIDFLLLGRVKFDNAQKALRDQYVHEHLQHGNQYAIRSSGGIIVVTKS